jgi:hypothetical protein
MDGKKIFESIGNFTCDKNDDWGKLIDFFNGNPLALELVARYISDTSLSCNISEFLQQGSHIFGDPLDINDNDIKQEEKSREDIRKLLDWHFQRLSEKEKEIMYWLAINREPVSITELIYDIFPLAKEIDERNQNKKEKNQHLLQIKMTLQSLQRRIPLEKSYDKNQDSYGLQPVLIEYMTERLTEEIYQEIKTGKLTDSSKLNRYALVKATAKAYIFEDQRRSILKQITNQLKRG